MQGEAAIRKLAATVEEDSFFSCRGCAIATAEQGRYTIPFKQAERSFASEDLLR